jgi:cytochrome c biogenesis protein CcdA
VNSNPCPLADGSSVPFSDCNFTSLLGKPEILMGSGNIAVNGSCVPKKTELTITKIASLAAVDAINPCEFAVLLLMLVAILTYNPNNKKKVLLAGFAFALSVFVMYFIYGLIIVKLFQLIQSIMFIKIFLYKVLAIGAIILGILNIRDFINYRPGRLATEMPVMFRPKVKKIISRVTSPAGAFVVGIFVTLFLMPCTMGPYFIAGGILSSLQFMQTLPWLALYNFIFIIPMIIITLIVYGGLASVENLSGWKERNIKYIHLAAGLIMLALGLIMLLGWV